MTYEETKINNAKNAPGITHKMIVTAAKKLSTPSLIWILIARHKMFFLIAGNVLLVTNWAIPMWPEMVKSILGAAF